MMTTATQTATYNGRTYRLLWAGSTKYGRRAKLGFMDGSKEFWVDAAKVGGGEKNAVRRCKCCGIKLVAGQYRRDGVCWDCVNGAQ